MEGDNVLLTILDAYLTLASTADILENTLFIFYCFML